MNEINRILDSVANGARLNIDEAEAIQNGKKVIQRIYLDGTKYLVIEISIFDTSVRSQIVGGL